MEDDEQGWYNDTAFNNAQPNATLQPITWSASEFVSHQKTTLWYIGLGATSAVITLVVYAVTRNILSAIVVATAFMALGVLAARKPETKSFEISTSGVRVGAQGYPYSLFKSYSVVEDGAINCIWLRPLKRFMPTVAMYYSPDDEERIIMMLDNFLPQEDRQHDIVDRLSRRIRF